MSARTEPLIYIEFIEWDEYHGEDHPTPMFTTTEDRHIPLPSEGDHVTFGYVTDDDGERLDRWGYMSDRNYERTDSYQVDWIEYHYHHARETNDSGQFISNRLEATIEIVVTKDSGGRI